jgi:signal transduction histidine kinase
MRRTPVTTRIADFFGVPDAAGGSLGDGSWERPRPRIGRRDVALAAAVEAFGLVTLELVRSVGGFDRTDAPVWTQWLAVSTGAVLLLGRRRWPLVVAALAAAHMFVAGVTMPQVMGQMTLQVVYFVAILSGVAWSRDRRLMLVVVGAIVLFMFAWIAWSFAVGSAAQDMLDDAGRDQRPGLLPPVPAAVLMTLVINAVYFGGAIVGGQLAWRSARQKACLVEQSATIAAQAERLRDRAVVDERLRIARELHDVVAHHVSAMGVQAGAARRVLARDPEAAVRALADVEEASRTAVTQMRGLLGTMRDVEGASSEPRASDPSVADVEALVSDRRAPGRTLAYDLVESPAGAAADVPTAIGLSIYRTVQEALTNVDRHSTADRVTVVVRVDGTSPGPWAEVEVVDNGRPRRGSSGSGLGQLGIRERAATHRGEVEIGPRVGGGYRVRVRYPLPARTAANA